MRCESPRANYASQSMYCMGLIVECENRTAYPGGACKEGSLQQQMSGQAAVLDFEVRFS